MSALKTLFDNFSIIIISLLASVGCLFLFSLIPGPWYNE
jgi:hypothetical protein